MEWGKERELQASQKSEDFSQVLTIARVFKQELQMNRTHLIGDPGAELGKLAAPTWKWGKKSFCNPCTLQGTCEAWSPITREAA